MFDLNQKKSRGLIANSVTLVLAVFLCSALPSQVNGAKGALKMQYGAASLDGSAYQMYMDFHGIQYRKSSKILDDPNASVNYIRTDKTWKEIEKATADFQTKVYTPPNGVKNAGPILRKLGYKLKYKDDTILFSTIEELNRAKGSVVHLGERNQEAYDVLKQKGFEVGFAREPAPGVLFVKNPQEKARAISIVQRALG